MAKAPRASELSTLVSWQRAIPGDDFTRRDDDWRQVGKLRVKAVAKASREVVFADQVEALNNYELWCRKADVRPEDRLVESAGSRVWNVVGVQDYEEQHRWTRIDAVLSWRRSLAS